MATLNAYSIYDRKGLFYATPWFVVNDATAHRAFADLVNDPQSTVSRHPSDYVLFCVGSYDDDKGQLEPLSPLRHVVDGSACVIQGHDPVRAYVQPQPEGVK